MSLSSKMPTPEQLISILQSINSNFWTIESAIAQHEEIGEQLAEARRETSKVMRAFKAAYPDIFDGFDVIEGSKPHLSAVTS